MSYESLIVGIDPGTTSAYACLTINGDVLEVYSSKEMDLSGMIKRVTELGLPVIVASDKLSVPDFVKQFARKTSARLVKFGQDLQVEAKRELTKNHDFSNDHERDALASAILAYKRNRALIEKIQRYVTLHGKEKIQDKIAQYVLTKEISIDLAVKILEEPEKNEVQTLKRAVEDTQKGETYYSLLEKFNKKLDEIELLNQENQELSKKLNLERENNRKLREKSSKETKGLRLRSKEQYISKLQDSVKKYKDELKSLQKELYDLHRLIPTQKVIAKRLKRLTRQELKQKENIFIVKDDDVLFLDDPNSFSRTVLKELKNKNIILVASSSNENLEEVFTVIREKELNIKKTRYYCFIDKDDFEKALKNKNILKRVIEDYKKTRE